MAILVTGSTGAIRYQVVHLAQKGAEVLALTRSPEKAKLPPGVIPVKGNLMGRRRNRGRHRQDKHAVFAQRRHPRRAFAGAAGCGLAREAGVKRIVYFSVFHSDVFTEPSHISPANTRSSE